VSQLHPDAVDDAVAGLTFDAAGLLPAVVQDDADGAVLMVAWMDAEAVRRTLTTGRTWFWSRSRREHWRKGDTSGHVQHVRSVTADCDGDTLLVRVEQVGPACHLGTRSCFEAPLPAVVGP
jgi:phosphoribosyl-AMP cyclohydrolase